jgi:hypothetical protein
MVFLVKPGHLKIGTVDNQTERTRRCNIAFRFIGLVNGKNKMASEPLYTIPKPVQNSNDQTLSDWAFN